ncbi:MAG TPA: hypothetical protein VEC35_19375 [Noviherbaspirillum sp.]|nr:hypothetical protein [Noviherbaspirillum sp.]
MQPIHARRLLAALILAATVMPAAAEVYWVAVANVDRRTCPAQTCGTVGFLRYKDKVEAQEVKGGWARVSGEYSAMCSGGRSEIVESGNDECVPKNGITKGVFSEWVPVQSLSKTVPTGPAPK